MPIVLPNGEAIVLQMYKAEVFTPEFNVFLASQRSTPFLFDQGAHYWGTADSDEESLAAISVFAAEVSGMIRYKGIHYTIGKMETTMDDMHIVYESDQVNLPMDLGCDTDPAIHTIGTSTEDEGGSRNGNKCVRMYVEVDYDIFVGKGGVTQAANYVAGAFSQVAILYANDGMTLLVNELLVWDIVDPYTGPSTSNYLNQFRVALNGVYNGDLAHLVGYQGGGGIAYLNVLCNRQYGIGYSAINSTYNNVPTYSWTVMVLAHEIGHNLGSQHTHDCAWNGNNTPIDCCGQNAGYAGSGCASGFTCNIPDPVDGGTIMGYCHLRPVKINLAFGFGPQPTARMQSRINAASCLQTCGEEEEVYDAGVTAIIEPGAFPCSNSIAPVVVITNFGNTGIQTMQIQYRIGNGTWLNFSWTGNLAPNATAQVTLPSLSYNPGVNTFSARTQSPNGNNDANPGNDMSSRTFEYIVGWCDCNAATTQFPQNPLTRQGNGVSTTSVTLPAGSKFPAFSITGLDARTGGNPNQRYNEEVTVNYVNGAGQTVLYGVFSGSNQSSVQVDIQTFVQSISVSLRNSLNNGFNGTFSVNFSGINFCSGAEPCGDEDGDGICDEDDICPGFDDNLIGTACDDGDPCTTNDVYTTNCTCEGTPIPNCGEEEDCNINIQSNFSVNPLTHTGQGFSSSSVSFPSGNQNVDFTISNLDARLNGPQNGRYNDRATVLFMDGNGQQNTYGVFLGSQQSTVNVQINGFVQSLTVRLDDAFDGDPSPNTISITLSSVSSCVSEAPLVKPELDQSEIRCFPNPASSILFIQLPWTENTQQLEILYLHGKVMDQVSIYGGVAERAIAHWPSGVYIIRIKDSEMKPLRFVKQ
jgi:hypothetical protein